MNKRISRSAFALITGGLLISPIVGQVANAQTVTNPGSITATAKFPSAPPSGVTGVTLVENCKNYTSNSAVNLPGGSTGVASATSTPFFGGNLGTAGASFITNIGLQTTNTGTGTFGTSCVFTAVVTGTANTAAASVAISVGGADRAAVNTLIANGTSTTLQTVSASTGEIAVNSSTDVVVTVTFPSITVKKVVVGEEATPGAAYAMTINCSTSGTPAFINTYSGYTTSPQYTTAIVAGFPAGLILPSGAKNYVTYAVRNINVAGDVELWAVYDARTAAADAVVPAGLQGAVVGDIAGLNTVFNAGNVTANGGSAAYAAASWTGFLGLLKFQVGSATALAPNTGGTPAFNGSFSLKKGESRTFTNNEFPGLTAGSNCEIIETNAFGMPVTLYSSTNAAGGTDAGTGGTAATGAYRSALTQSNGQTVTVTNAAYGSLVVSKVVTGDAKTNIATYEIQVSCDQGGPKDTFLLKDRQSKVYSNIVSGTNCLVTELKSDGAFASYNDNSGDNTTDGRVVIKRAGNGCAAVGAPSNAAPGGPAPVTSFNECWANVIITNTYFAATETTAAAKAAAPAPAPATTAAPAPAPSPAPATPTPEAVEAETSFAG